MHMYLFGPVPPTIRHVKLQSYEINYIPLSYTNCIVKSYIFFMSKEICPFGFRVKLEITF